MDWGLRLSDLYSEVRLFISNVIAEKGVESSYISSKLVLKLPSTLDILLNNGNMVVEITQDELLDENGYHYSYGQISYEHLMEIADYLQTL